jgi:hypothetical protein
MADDEAGGKEEWSSLPLSFGILEDDAQDPLLRSQHATFSHHGRRDKNELKHCGETYIYFGRFGLRQEWAEMISEWRPELCIDSFINHICWPNYSREKKTRLQIVKKVIKHD